MTKANNIALVANALHIGGMESFLLGLGSRLRLKGFDVTFVVTQSVGAWHGRPAEEGFKLVSILPKKWESRRGHARRVGNFLKTFDAVMLNHTLTGQSSLGLLPESTVAITVLHNHDEPIYQLGLANLANVDMVVAVSERVCNEAKRRGAPTDRTMCIRNGVEVFPSYPKGSASEIERPLKVIFIGRIDHAQKGVFYLPGIISNAVAAGASVSFDIVGSGEADFELLRRQMTELEQSGVATIHGALPHKDAMGLLQSADVLLMPSHYEGQPIILFEAMARGVVPVVSLLPGITDAVVEGGESGLLSPVGDENAFAEALVQLAGDRQLLGKMSHSAWRTALENYSNETMTAQYVELIEDCRRRREEGKVPSRNGRVEYGVLGRFSRLPSIVYDVMKVVQRLIPSAG